MYPLCLFCLKLLFESCIILLHSVNRQEPASESREAEMEK